MMIKLIFAAALLMIMGCSSTQPLEDLRDNDYTVGCVVVEANLNLGFSSGSAEICKIKCSESLPDGFVYDYNNLNTGCRIGINLGQ